MVERILELMKEHKLNGIELAEKSGVPKNAVSQWKSGKFKPSADAVIKLADFFQVSLDYLYGRTNNRIGVDLTLNDVIPYGIRYSDVMQHEKFYESHTQSKSDLEIVKAAIKKALIESGMVASDSTIPLAYQKFIEKLVLELEPVTRESEHIG